MQIFHRFVRGESDDDTIDSESFNTTITEGLDDEEEEEEEEEEEDTSRK